MKTIRIFACVLLLFAGNAWAAGEITSLPALSTAPDTGDLIEIVDVSDTTDSAGGSSKKITVQNILTRLGATSIDLITEGIVTGRMNIVPLTIASGVHDGGDDEAILGDSGESFASGEFVGMTLYNVTDGSSCLVTANDGTTVTCALSGGTGDDWDDGDVWQVGPGPRQSGSIFAVTAASTIRHPPVMGYTAMYFSNGTAKLTVDMASDSMVFKGTLDSAVVALDAGDSIDSSGTTGDDFIVIVNFSSTSAKGFGKRGTWVDGGAD